MTTNRNRSHVSRAFISCHYLNVSPKIISCEFVARVLLCCFCCSGTSHTSVNFSLKPNSTSIMPARCPADVYISAGVPALILELPSGPLIGIGRRPFIKILTTQKKCPFSHALLYSEVNRAFYTQVHMYINKNSTICVWAVIVSAYIYMKMRIKGGKTLNENLKYIRHFRPSVHIRKVNNYLSAICENNSFTSESSFPLLFSVVSAGCDRTFLCIQNSHFRFCTKNCVMPKSHLNGDMFMISSGRGPFLVTQTSGFYTGGADVTTLRWLVSDVRLMSAQCLPIARYLSWGHPSGPSAGIGQRPFVSNSSPDLSLTSTHHTMPPNREHRLTSGLNVTETLGMY